MNVKLPWVNDPKDDKPSVTLSLMLLAVLMLIVAFGLDLADKVKDTSIAVEFFGITAGLYLGRKLSYKGLSADPTPEETKK